MKHEIEEIVNEALMCGEATILVEGLDDIKFYDNVAKKADCTLNIQAIETVEGYNEGCESVIKAIEDIQDLIQRDKRLQPYILGIIDRDGRYYREGLPGLKCLFILKYYSYESHLITKSTIRKQIAYMTKVSDNMITDEIIESIIDEFNKSLKPLYYISLEALKSHCNSEYRGCVTYGKKAGNIFGYNAQEYIWNQIESKIDELNIFADNYGITQRDIKYIAKGKWLLHVWCDLIIRKTKDLYRWCGNKLPQCQMCEVNKADKCLWRVEGNFQISHIMNYLRSYDVIETEEIKYISERLKLLAS